MTEARAIGPKYRLSIALRQTPLDVLKLLADQTACEIDIDIVLEVNADVRQAEERDRTNLLDTRQPGHRTFNRRGKQFFDVLGGKAGRLCINIDLDWGDVGKRVHWHVAKRLDAQADQDREENQNKNLVTQRCVDDGVEHFYFLALLCADLRLQYACLEGIRPCAHDLLARLQTGFHDGSIT